MDPQNLPPFAQVATWLGIVNQLYNTRMSHLLAEDDFTITQFAMLNHLARHSSQQHTISTLANAIDINQPGATKIVKKLSGLGLVAVGRDSADSRKRLVSILPAGFEMIGSVQRRMGPDVQSWFADWSDEELAQFKIGLTKLGTWLDANRLP